MSGVGFARLGATRRRHFSNNKSRDNLPGGPVDLTGGVIVIGGFGGTLPLNTRSRTT